MTNLWIDEEEARRRMDETLELFSPEREAIEEIVREDPRPSLRHRIGRVLARVGGPRADESFDMADEFIVEPGDLIGTRYVVWRPERFDY
jgi:hypothetical protein